MKLSKAQQEVVDKMREGWEYKGDYLIDPHGKWYNVHGNTWNALLKKHVITRIVASNEHPTYRRYRLTEQYKTQQDEK